MYLVTSINCIKRSDPQSPFVILVSKSKIGFCTCAYFIQNSFFFFSETLLKRGQFIHNCWLKAISMIFTKEWMKTPENPNTEI